VYQHVLREDTFNLSVVCLFDRVVLWKDKIIQLILTKIEQADTWCTSWFNGNIQQTNIVYLFDWVVSWKDKTIQFSRAKIEQANTRCTSCFRGKIQQTSTVYFFDRVVLWKDTVS
jgi:hypothetical protein